MQFRYDTIKEREGVFNKFPNHYTDILLEDISSKKERGCQ